MKLNMIAIIVITIILSLGLSARLEAQDWIWGHGKRRNYAVYAPYSTNGKYYYDDYYSWRSKPRRYYRHKYHGGRSRHEYYYDRDRSYNRNYDRRDDVKYYYRGGGY